MRAIELTDFDAKLPSSLAVSVIMQKTPSDHPWIDFTYEAVGVLVNDAQPQPNQVTCRKIHADQDAEQFLIEGLSLSLYADECESYYHNLKSPQPGCYIVASQTDDPNAMPMPYLVSLSFDEVHAYLEGDEPIYAVEIPRQLYQWVEAYVLTHYVAEKKTKRKLKNWREEARKPATITNNGRS